jgi:hypothetical protein
MFKMWQTSLETGQAQQTVCLLGPPGVGKTSQGASLAELMTEFMRAKNPNARPAICRELDLSSMLPEDLNGLPFRSKVDNTEPAQYVTQFSAHTWLHELCQPDAYGVLILDDLPAAAPMMQVAARQVSLARRIHDNHLAPGIFIIVTGNRREDKASASTLPSHFRNSVMMLSVELDVDEWATWYGKDETRDPIIPSFLRWKRELLSQLPASADQDSGAFATPRTWAKLGHQYRVASDTGTLMEVAMGLVGKGPGGELCAFVKTRMELVDPAKVFDDPRRWLPEPGRSLNTPDRQVAMATALGEIAAQRSKHGKRAEAEEAPLKLLRAVSWATSDHREYCGASVATFIANGGSLQQLLKTAAAHKNDEDISKLLGFLKLALGQQAKPDAAKRK